VKLSLLKHLRCPECRAVLKMGGSTRLETTSARGEVVEGTLTCSACSRHFAITGGIPRMHTVDSPDGTRRLTSASFGYLWGRSIPGQVVFDPKAFYYAKMENRLSLPPPRGLVLDAGCGDGIDLANQATREGVEVIGVELSDGGCRTSYARTRDFPRAHVVQADLCRLPFAEATFDFAYSYGVLHHLGAPDRGLREIVRVSKAGATVAAYLYEDFSERGRLLRWSLKAANSARALTTQLPNRVLYGLCTLASPVVYTTFTLPARIARRVSVLAPLANSLPFRHGTGPFSLVGDLYDRFSAPVEYRYSRSSSQTFFRHAGLEHVTVADERGWMVSGIKSGIGG
jgi:SAM-dependent methyltransferase/uncharacterized protein YbaR (Trm112 family)